MPALPVALGLMCGIAAEHLTLSPLWPSLAALSAIVFYLRRMHYPAFALIGVAAGWCLAYSATWDTIPKRACGDSCALTATVESTKEGRASTMYVMEVFKVSDADGMPTPCRKFRISGYLAGFETAFSAGDTVSCTCILIPLPRPHYMPGVSESDAALSAIGIDARADNMEITDVTHGDRSTRTIRSELLHRIAGSGMSHESTAVTAAIILGDRSALSDELRERYRSAGLAHILALSGLHVGILLAIVCAIMTPLRLTKRHKYIFEAVTIALIWLYAGFTGWNSPVVRASLMATMILAGRLCGRRYSAINAIALAAICILAYRPLALFEAGFQLSFAAVFSIVVFSRFLNPWERSHNSALRHIGYAISVPLSASAGTFAITAWWFGSFPVYFLVSNLLICWIMPWLITVTATHVVLLAAGIECSWTAGVADKLCTFLNTSAEWISSLPYATVAVDRNVAIAAGITVAIAASAIIYMKTCKNRRSISVVLCAMMIAACIPIFTEAITSVDSGTTEIFVLDRHGSPAVAVYEGNNRAVVLIAQDGSDAPDEERYRKYRHVDSVHILLGNEITTGGITFFIANNKRSLKDRNANYLLAGSSYTANPRHALESLHPDTVILAGSTDKRQRALWMTACDSAGIPIKDLRHEGVHLILRNNGASGMR